MKIKKRTLYIFLLIMIIAIASFYIFSYKKDVYQINGDKLYYSSNRGKPEYTLEKIQTNQSITSHKINFDSRPFLDYPTKIYGLLFIPESNKKVPGVVLLPGGGVSKESESELARKIAKKGYAVITIDQRGIGQTGGYYLNYDDDLKLFLQGKEPIQHLSIYDILQTFDVFRSLKNIDSSKIALIGESMGGRYAIIAASIEKRIKGIIGISTAGFHFNSQTNDQQSIYFRSIDPDNYISDISPRKLFMFHGTNDTMVPIESAIKTFEKAKEPKHFFAANGCSHGYCNEMEKELEEALKDIFS